MRRLACLLFIFTVGIATVFPIAKIEASTFTDLESVPWAEDEINFLYDEGIINGYDEYRFGPLDYITRGQAAMMLVKALYPNEQARKIDYFPDVAQDKYYSNAVNVAYEKNIITGYLDQTFRPESDITRAGAAAMIDRAFQIDRGDRDTHFIDKLGWAEENILDLATNGIITGYPDGTFKQNKTISRAEFAVILARAINPSFIEKIEVTPPQDWDISSFEMEVVELTNKERIKQGLNPLIMDKELSRVARMKSQDMIDNEYFDHNSPRYGSPFEMMLREGIRFSMAAENIAAGYSTPESVVQGWMNSPGHRANILKSELTHIGVGFAEGGSYRYYWTQMFMTK